MNLQTHMRYEDLDDALDDADTLRRLPTTPFQVLLLVTGACNSARLWVGELSLWNAWDKQDDSISVYEVRLWKDWILSLFDYAEARDDESDRAVPYPEGCTCLRHITLLPAEQAMPYMLELIRWYKRTRVREVEAPMRLRDVYGDVLMAVIDELENAVDAHFTRSCEKCGDVWDIRTNPSNTCSWCPPVKPEDTSTVNLMNQTSDDGGTI